MAGAKNLSPQVTRRAADGIYTSREPLFVRFLLTSLNGVSNNKRDRCALAKRVTVRRIHRNSVVSYRFHIRNPFKTQSNHSPESKARIHRKSTGALSPRPRQRDRAVVRVSRVPCPFARPELAQR